MAKAELSRATCGLWLGFFWGCSASTSSTAGADGSPVDGAWRSFYSCNADGDPLTAP